MITLPHIAVGFLLISLAFCAQILLVTAVSMDNWAVSRHDSSQTGFSTSVAPKSEVVQLWNYTIDADTISAPESPVVAEGRVYIGSRDYGVCCLEATDGTKIWNFVTGANFDSSPAVVNGLVYAASDAGNIYCLDALNGNPIWDISVGVSINSPMNFADGRLYVVSTEGDLYCLDGSNGEKLWNFSTGGIVHTPSVADGCVFAGSYDGNLYCLNASSGAKIWQNLAGVFSLVSISGSAGSPTIAKGVVYVVGNGVLSAWSSPSSDDLTFPLFELILVAILAIIATVTIVYLYFKRK